MSKKKLTLAEARATVAAQDDLPVFINLENGAQALFDNRSDRRVSFKMLVGLSAKKAERGEWKGQVVDGKFVVTITESRMTTLLGEAGGIIDNQPLPSISEVESDRRLGGIKSFLRVLIAKYDDHVDFEPMKSLYDEASKEWEDMVLQDGGKEVYDFRPIVEKAQKAADMACDAVNASLSLHLKEVMEKGGKGRLYDQVIERLPDNRRDRLGELQRRLGTFFQFIPNRRQQPSGPPPEKRNGRRPVHGRHGLRDLSGADLHEEFGADKSVTGTYRY